MEYEWDEEKNKSNKKKHGISFIEAATVFEDAHAVEVYDPDSDPQEERFVTIGLSLKQRILTVVNVIREKRNNQEVIRIISARKATKKERGFYER